MNQIANLINWAALYPILLVANGAAWYVLKTSPDIASWWARRCDVANRWGIIRTHGQARMLAGYLAIRNKGSSKALQN